MSVDKSDEHVTQPIINILGEKVALGPMHRDLLPLYFKWINDFEVTRTLFLRFGPTTMEAEEAWFERVSKDVGQVQFTMYERDTLRPIGTAGLTQIEHKHRTAEFGILIGEKDCWNKGYGTETAMLLLDYGFNGLGLHNIMLRAASFNERGLSAYTRAGFREIGRRREVMWVSGRHYDVVYMDCLSSEFESPVMRQYLP